MRITGWEGVSQGVVLLLFLFIWYNIGDQGYRIWRDVRRWHLNVGTIFRTFTKHVCKPEMHPELANPMSLLYTDTSSNSRWINKNKTGIIKHLKNNANYINNLRTTFSCGCIQYVICLYDPTSDCTFIMKCCISIDIFNQFLWCHTIVLLYIIF